MTKPRSPRRRHELRRPRHWPILAAVAALVSVPFIVPLPQRAGPQFSKAVYSEDGRLLRAMLAKDEKWRLRHPSLATTAATGKANAGLRPLPTWLPQALICMEDKRFRWHPGVDPLALGRAALQNLQAGRTLSGASTLSMQTARLLEPRPRTLAAKAVEALRAVQYTLRLSKDEVLDLYLTYAPFGGNIEGIEAAAQAYFGKPANALNPGEGAFLLIMPQAPGRQASLKANELKALRDGVLEHWTACGVIDHASATEARQVPIPAGPQRPQVLAAHFSEWLAASEARRSVFRSTIDYDAQVAVERLALELRTDLHRQGIDNIAVLAADHRRGTLKAAVGNFAYFDGTAGQKLNSFVVPRSPGSTLKPFLYAYLIDKGRLLPESLVVDAPQRFDDYAPQNFDGYFSGLVSAEEALQKSLNVPFVRLLREAGIDQFLAFLEAGGMRVRQPRTELGLSFIIGAGEVAAIDLLRLYTALAAGGRMRPLRTEFSGSGPLGDSAAEEFPWLGPAAAYLTNLGLEKKDLPWMPDSHRHLQGGKVRWKTGTSQGRKDAWAVGFDEQHTVLVWLGNLDHRASRSLVGTDAAGPVMFRVFDLLQSRQRLPEDPPPYGDLAEVDICAYSGWLATTDCPAKRRALAAAHNPLQESCPFHQKFLVDRVTGLRLSRECSAGKETEQRSFLNLPPEILLWLRDSHPRFAAVPGYHPSCQAAPMAAAGALLIKSPEPGKQYFLWNAASTLVLPLKLSFRSRWEDIACFLDGSQVDLSRRDPTLTLRAGVGRHNLFCSDLLGNSHESRFWVSKG